MSLADLRRDYARASLAEGDVDRDPIAQFRRWFDEAVAAAILEPNAMTLATADASGAPSARVVLLKALDERGFVFFTDYRSRKGRELAANPRGALVFLWKEIERQVRVTGTVARTSAAESTAYFRSRPRASRLSAAASVQSQVIPGRAVLEARVRELAERCGTDAEIPRPAEWGGYLLSPSEIEFWQGRASRLHDRLRYTRAGDGGWRIDRLSP